MISKTYKDKIRERFLNKKRQASLSHSPQHFETVGIGQVLNSDYVKEEAEVQTILQNSKQQEDTERYIDNQLETEIAFFTDIIFDKMIDKERTYSENSLEPSEQSLKSASPIHDSSARLASSFVQVEDVNTIERVVNEITYKDHDLLYYPSNHEPDISLRIQQNDNCRNIQEEGLYTPQVPKVKYKNKMILYNRFIEENALDWFDSSGEMVKLVSFSQDTQLYTTKTSKKFTPIFVESTNHLSSVGHLREDNKILKFHIQDIVFDYHPAFGEEHIQEKKIENLYKIYIRRKNKKVNEILQQRITVLRELIAELQCQNNQESDEKITQIIDCRTELRELRNKLHTENKVDRDLTRNLLEEWRSLKRIREKQKYRATATKLSISLQETDLNEDQQQWDDTFEVELKELIDEAFEDYYEEKNKQRQLGGNLKIVRKPDTEGLKSHLLNMYLSSKRLPGEPIVTLNIEKKEIPADTGNVPIEKKRQLVISESVYLIKILFDDVVVSSAKSLTMNMNFEVIFDTSFSIQLTTKIPDEIKLQIFDCNRYRAMTKIATLYLPIPENTELFSESSFQSLEFSSQKNLSSEMGVGTVQSSSENNHFTKGFLKIKLGWAQPIDDDNGKFAKKTAAGGNKLTKNQICDWYDQHLLDPMDPDANVIMDIMRSPSEGHQLEANPKSFYFNEDLMTFCSEEEVKNNPRFNMLTARSKNTIKYKDMKLIPHSEREIQQPTDTKIINEVIGMDPIDLQRHNGKKYLLSVYETISNHCKMICEDSEHSSLLLSQQEASFSSISSAFLRIFGPKRPLKPTRRSQPSRAAYRNNELQNFHISVNVVRAFGIPSRIDDQTRDSIRRNSNISSTQQSFKTINVRPYIVIHLKDKTARTSTAEGSNPTWNEQLSVPLNIKMDCIKGFLCIQLFDEYVDDLLDDDRSRLTEIYQRISSKWLGEIRIPISTIYANQRIEGTFQLNSPSILLGYSKPSLSSPTTSIFIADNLPDIRGPTYVSLFISLEPIMELPKFLTVGLECTELQQTKAKIQLWCEEYENDFPHRNVDPLVTLLSGKRVCITRLLGAIRTPFDNDINTEFLIRKYVSLIPVMHSMDQCTKLNGIWLTNDQILNLMRASPKDLAVLLTCFYLSLNFEVWLILGHGLLTGDSCFVLLKENGEFFIVDPLSGKKYNSNDIYSPLIKIYLLVNEFNIWGNIQQEKRVYMTRFDVQKSAEWRPLFTKAQDVPSGLLHEIDFVYKPSDDVNDLQKIIEMKLMKKISSWRIPRKTIWNRYVREHLRQTLIDLEKDVGLESSADEHISKLNLLISTHKATGYPINMPYVSLSNIVDRVKSTGIYLSSDNRVEFSLAVHIHPYENNVLSVWIFLITLIPKIL